MSTPRYWLKVWPRRDRFPKRWWHWYRPATAALLLAGAVTAVAWAPSHLACADGLPNNARWSTGGDCVGTSDNAYNFGIRTLDAALKRIDQQNKAVRDGKSGCPTGSTITIGALLTLAAPNAGGRSPRELEGIAAAQAQANAAGCIHPVLVKIANMGSKEQAATDVAKMLKDDPTVVAVVGVGLSAQPSADAANLLGQRPDAVPMIADVLTASGFDAIGSKDREDIFSHCAATYPNGVGGGYFYRVAYNNGTQIAGLRKYLGSTKPDFILTPTDLSDPYTCTAFALVEKNFSQVTPVKFDPTDPSTVPVAVQRICSTSRPVTAIYTARSGDLGRFIQDINTAYQNGTCQPSSITLVSPSDASRLLATEPNADLEAIRQAALTSDIFQQGKLKLVYATLMNADTMRGSAQYQQLVKRMTEAGFSPADLADGWAVNAYDALGAVAQASRPLGSNQTVTRGQINTAVSSLTTVGAGGHIAFDPAGNRIGESTIVRLCPAPAGKPVFTVLASAAACA